MSQQKASISAQRQPCISLCPSLVSQGLAVIMVSSELPEVMGMADRIIVMHEGLMVAEYQAGDATAETIVSAASGAKQEAA